MQALEKTALAAASPHSKRKNGSIILMDERVAEKARWNFVFG